MAAGILSQNIDNLNKLWRGRCAAIVVAKLQMWAYVRDPSRPNPVRMLFNGWRVSGTASINPRAERVYTTPVTCDLRNITSEDAPARPRRRSTPKDVEITWEPGRDRGPEFCPILRDRLKLGGWYCVRAQRITAGGEIHIPHNSKNSDAVMRFLSDTIGKTLGLPVDCHAQMGLD